MKIYRLFDGDKQILGACFNSPPLHTRANLPPYLQRFYKEHPNYSVEYLEPYTGRRRIPDIMRYLGRLQQQE